MAEIGTIIALFHPTARPAMIATVVIGVTLGVSMRSRPMTPMVISKMSIAVSRMRSGTGAPNSWTYSNNHGNDPELLELLDANDGIHRGKVAHLMA